MGQTSPQNTLSHLITRKRLPPLLPPHLLAGAWSSFTHAQNLGLARDVGPAA